MGMPNEAVAYELLEKLSISYTKLEHEAITSVRDTDIVLPGQQVKNLCLKTKKGRQYYLVILRDEKIADLKHLAEALEVNRLSFVREDELMELLSVEPGKVTPFGLLYDTENKVQVVIDEEVDKNDTVGFHPFVNTATLNIPFVDFLRFLDYVHHEPMYVMC